MVSAVSREPYRRRSPGKPFAFSLVEILVVLAVAAVLVAVMVPTVQTTRRRTNQLKCMNNMRQIGLAMNMHLMEKKRYPLGSGTNNFQAALAPYMNLTVPDASTYRLDDRFLCSETLKIFKPGQPGLWGYGYNETVVVDPAPSTAPIWPSISYGGYACVKDAVNITNPARKIALLCNRGGNFWAYPPYDIFAFGPNPWLIYPVGIHDGRDNYLFCDGHVESIVQTDQNRVNEGWFVYAKGSPYQD